MRKVIIFFILLASFSNVYSQKSIAELYTAYTVIRTTNNNKLAAIDLAINILKRSSELTNSQIANLNFNLGRLYEETMEEEKAVPYYESSLILALNYYVTHRALGSVYVKRSDPIVKINSKALPHLEKAQACEPDGQSLKQIINLYKNIKNLAAFGTLYARLKKHAVSCVDLLDD